MCILGVMAGGTDIKKPARFLELEALRGLAAIIVVIGHFVFAFYPLLMLGPTVGVPQHMSLENTVHGTPLGIIFSGTFSVVLFFILSGFVLTIGFFQTKNTEIIKNLAARRYLRLMLPALASVILCLIIIKLGISHIDSAAAATQSSWLGDTWKFSASFYDAIYNGTIGIFLQGASPYNNVLWTMTTEFLGSFIVFGFVLLFGAAKHRWISYLGLIALTFNTWFLAFVVGMALADLYSLNIIRKNIKMPTVAVLTVTAVYLGAFPNGTTEGRFYGWLTPGALDELNINYTIFYMTIGASLLVFAVLFSDKLSRFMSKPQISALGKYTFSLYLVHLLVLYVFTTYVFVKLNPSVGYNTAVMLAALSSIPVIMIATYLFEKYIDKPSINLARWWADVLAGRQSIDMRAKFVVISARYQTLLVQLRQSRIVRWKYIINEDESEQ